MEWTARGLRVGVDVSPERLAVVAGAAVEPMAGRFEGGEFVPRFPFVPGTSYSVLVDGVAVASLEAPRTAVPRVVSIHPDVPVVPVNLLKVYVHFDAPVERVTIGPEDVFLDLELWDRSRTRRTLLLDPGRIKRGLAGHEQLGYPLVEGREFTLRAGDASRTYRVGPAVEARVDPAAWRVQARAGLLSIRFDRPLDHALLQHALDPGVPGTAECGDTWWRFRPDAPFAPGEHALAIDARLEDLAGNSVRRVFDRDLTDPADDPLGAGRVILRFTVGHPAG